jgi:histidine decarboxylase
METILEKVKEELKTFIGYPLNAAYDYSGVIKSFLLNMNNIGCPFTHSTLKINTKDVELEVLEFFAQLWGICTSNIWGYITSSGTEGNLQGIYVGREFLGNKPVFYTSRESHYSIFKIARLLDLDMKVIQTSETGEMDYKDFEDKLSQNLDRPVLINANLGTTMKCAIDDTREIYRVLKKYKKHNDYYLHADAALMGFVLPFIEKDLFFKNHIHSIAISGHKFLGIPFPCGVFLMEKRFLAKVSTAVEYIGTIDCTISGSRSGHSPLFFKHIIDTKGIDGFKKDIEACIENAEYLAEKLPNAWRNQNSIIVVFPKPADDIVHKWQLATSENVSHVVVMPHVTKELLDDFIVDMLMS